MKLPKPKFLVTTVFIGLWTAGVIAQSKVFITEHGSRYHLYSNCRSLAKSDWKETTLDKVGDRTLCAICKHRHFKEEK